MFNKINLLYYKIETHSLKYLLRAHYSLVCISLLHVEMLYKRGISEYNVSKYSIF